MTESHQADGLVTRRLRVYWAAEAARDVDRIIACFTADAEFVDRLGVVTQGQDALRAFYERSAAAFPRAQVEPTRIVEQDGVAAVAYTAHLWGADGAPERTARVAVFVTLEGDLISRIESYFDGAQLR